MWRQVIIQYEPGFEDIVSLCIFESGFSGLVEREGSDGLTYTAYYYADPDMPDPLERLAAALKENSGNNGSPAKIGKVEDVPQEDWEASWREGLGALEIGDRLTVRPSWIDYENDNDRIEVVIDPKRAFGTGSHETTRLCLEFLEKINLKDVSVLDAGCGSAILSIAAVKLGARCAIGFDIDADSIVNADENIRSNRVQDYVTVYQADLSQIDPGHFNLILANVISGVLIPNLRRFKRFLLPGGWAVFSGILAEEQEEFLSALNAAGFKMLEQQQIGEWIMIVAESKF